MTTAGTPHAHAKLTVKKQSKIIDIDYNGLQIVAITTNIYRFSSIGKWSSVFRLTGYIGFPPLNVKSKTSYIFGNIPISSQILMV